MKSISRSARVGPYELERVVGSGGMASVFEAVRADGGPRVALKVLTGEEATESRRRGRFQREVHALARLEHPCIARVVDFGEVGRGDEAPDDFEIRRGSPWLAMEYVAGERFPVVPEWWNWERLQGAILQILGAMAHAHSDKILHRDLKPSNVMIRSDGEGIAVKVVDFGLARVLEAEEQGGYVTMTEERVVGTPNYMAPEQISGTRREQGPWTDLYALGCLVWRSVTGRAPFDAEAEIDVLRKQLYEEPPAFEPRFPVPPGLEDWLRALLARSPADRVRRAADAIWAFVSLGPPDADGSAEPRTGEGNGGLREESSYGDTLRDSLARTAPLEELHVEESPTREGGDSPAAEIGPPPFPPTWQRTETGNDERKPAVRSGLLGLRRIPFVDRRIERDRLWRDLRRAARRASPVPVIVEGREGIGKSRLASWLARRSHELGASTPLRAIHSPGNQGPRDGLEAMFSRYLRCLGLDEEEVREALDRDSVQLEFEGPGAEHDRMAFAAMIAPTPGTTQPGESGGPPDHRTRFRLMTNALESIARERPIVLWLDDVQWNPDALRFVRHLCGCDDGRDLPICVVATYDPTAISDDAPAVEAIEGLRESADTRTVDLGALHSDDVRRLASESLGLAGEAAEAVVARSEGNPLYAIELVRNWADAEALESGPSGYEVDRGLLDSMPGGLRQIWIERLRRVVESFDPEMRGGCTDSIAVAALLGRTVETSEWRATREVLGIDAPSLNALTNRLARFGLVESVGDAWAFSHELAREVVRDHLVGDEGHRLHRACAEGLRARYGPEAIAHAKRLAEHWIGAEEFERGLDALELAIRRASYFDSVDTGRRLIDRHARVLRELEGASLERRTFRNELLGAWLDLHEGGAPSSEGDFEALRRRAEREEWSYEEGVASALLGRIYRERRELERAREHYQRAVRLIEPERARVQWGAACAGFAQVFRNRGEIGRAAELMERAAEQFEAAGAEGHRLVLLGDRMYLRALQGDTERAFRVLQRVRRRAREAGLRTAAATVTNNIGDVARMEGRLGEALAAYRQSRALQEEIGRNRPTAADVNIAVTRLERGEYERAETELQGLERERRSGSDSAWGPAIAMGLGTLRLARGRTAEATDQFRKAVDEIRSADEAFVDFARQAELFGSIARDHGETNLAAEAFEFALEQLETLGLQERAEKLRERLRDLG